MKLFKEKSPFAAVVITLESQDEVNQLYAACNHTTVSKALPFLDDLWGGLPGIRQKPTGSTIKLSHKQLKEKTNEH